MELSPAEIAEATFRTIRKGYDPNEVDAFLTECAKALEAARQQATAMEARARAAVNRLQEASSGQGDVVAEPAPAAQPAEPAQPDLPRVEAETISRTLLLAQRTADNTIAEARAEAERIVNEATLEAETTIDSTREMAAKLLGDAKAEARKVNERERKAAENEVQALVARREFLVGDVDQLERFLIDQRERLRGAARQIEALCDRVPAGLGSVRPPALSASDDDEPGDPTMEMERPDGGNTDAAGPTETDDDRSGEPPEPARTDEDLPLRTTNLTNGGDGRPRRSGDATGPADR